MNGASTLHGLLYTPGGQYSTGVIQSLLEGIFSNPANFALAVQDLGSTGLRASAHFDCPNVATNQDCVLFLDQSLAANLGTVIGFHNSSPSYGWVGLYGANNLLQWNSTGVQANVNFSAPMVLPTILYSVAGTSLPSCSTALKGAVAVVSDGLSPSWHGSYAGSGAITSGVICSYNGSSYGWLFQ